MKLPAKFTITHIYWIVLFAVFGYLMYWRWQVGMHRFFDVDEFSYLHWVASMARGERPYVDFFMFFTPGFLWFFAPVVTLFSYQATVFIAARVVAFFIFLGMTVMLMALFGKTRGWRWFIVPGIVLAFLPMPYDKMMEVRPDNLATLFAIAGIFVEVLALQSKSSKHSWFLSGFLYTASLLVFAKTLPIVAAGIAIAFYASWWGNGRSLRAWFNSLLHGKPERDALYFIAGLVFPTVLFFLWALTLGDFDTVWYSLTKLPFEANMIGKLGVMEPHLFFFPNGSFYGGVASVNIPLVLNHSIWFIGILMGVYRLVTAWSTTNGVRKLVLIEFLLSISFLLSVFGYIQFFPLKHSQYLIPIAVFIAYYFADFFVRMLGYVRLYLSQIGVAIVVCVVCYWIGVGVVQTNTVKLAWNNDLQLSQMKIFTEYIPKDAGVLDLEGRLLFWRNDYEICCVPFGSFVPFLSRKPRLLRDVLEAKKTPYIYQGDSNRISLLTQEDLAYIRLNYIPVEGWGETFWSRKK